MPLNRTLAAQVESLAVLAAVWPGWVRRSIRRHTRELAAAGYDVDRVRVIVLTGAADDVESVAESN